MAERQNNIGWQLAEGYRRDTNAMVLIFAQWCVNHELDPLELYKEAYPDQDVPTELSSMLALTVPREEAGEIATDMVLNVLMAFDNEALAFVVRKVEKIMEKRG